MFTASGQVCCIDGNVHLGINSVSDPENLVCATPDWKHVSDDPTHKQHCDMFTHFFDEETCELMDPARLHHFCLASKLNADNCLSFSKILCMDKETREEHFDAMDKELQDLSIKSGTFKFVSQTKCSNRARKLFQQHGLFGRNVILPEKSTNSRHACAFLEIFNAKIIQTMKHLPQWWNGQ